MSEENKANEGLKYSYKYPHPSVTTDCVIFGFDGVKLKVLLVERGMAPYKGRWAFPGGFYALVRMQEVKGGDDASDARWFALDEVPPLAFDHDQILRKAEKTLRQQIHFEPVGFELLPEKFTIKQLQNLYEAILDMRFDRRNFYNKMRRLGMLELTGDTANPSQRREANLFSFNAEKYAELKSKGFQLEF